MQFTVILALAASAVALPNMMPNAGAMAGASHDVKFTVPSDMTVAQAQAKCGDKATLSCCNKAIYAGDSTQANSGLLSGALSGLIGQGSGAQGLGLFDQCSKLDIPIGIIQIAQLNDLVNQQCKQNIACCDNSPSNQYNNLIGVGLPCIALGSII